jgi:bifunctional lysine-specific demethylase and histidyl-hydroxylase NO66
MPQCLSGVDVEFSLAWLLQPLSVETFLNEIWAQTHYHVKRHCVGYFDSLLPGPSAVEDLLARILRGDWCGLVLMPSCVAG